MTTVTIPQPVMPFAIGPDGFPGICEQGSAQDIASKALTFLSCPQGANPYDPEFGLPAQLFGRLPLNLSAIKAALAQYIPELLNPSLTETYNADGLITEVIEGLYPSDQLFPSSDLHLGGDVQLFGSGAVSINLTGYTEGS